MNKLTDSIKKKLQKTKTKPSWYFSLLNILKDIGIILGIILAVLALGIIVYIIAHDNPWQIPLSRPGFIGSGLPALPWELMVILAGMIFIIYFLIKKVHFIYRQNNLLIIGAIIVLTVCGYFIAEASGLNKTVASAPLAREIYKRQGKIIAPNRGPAIVGEIIKVTDTEIIIEDPLEKTWTIKITSDTKSKKDDELQVGDRIQVIGKKTGQEIEAFGIKKIDDEEELREFMHESHMGEGGQMMRKGQMNYQYRINKTLRD